MPVTRMRFVVAVGLFFSTVLMAPDIASGVLDSALEPHVVSLKAQAPLTIAGATKTSPAKVDVKAKPVKERAGNSTSRRRDNTGTSGPRGDDHGEVNIGENNGRHIYGLKWSERNDKPCYIDVFTGGFVTGKFEPLTRDGEVDGSECKAKGTSMKTLNFGSPSGGTFWAVDGVKVCMNKKGTRLKGIKLYAEKIEEGAFLGTTTSKSVERTNCADWKGKKECPANQIASELVFHWSDGAITGIELECSEYGWE